VFLILQKYKVRNKISLAMDYDTILEEIGGFGKFQIKILMLVCLPVLYGAANSLSYIFTSRKPPYR
jgi:OCT family organic cation transporter-like MFS transporter 4/5